MKDKMFITRIDSAKKVINTGRVNSDIEVKVIDITIGCKRFRITPDFDNKIRIHKADIDNSINVHPAFANEILIS